MVREDITACRKAEREDADQVDTKRAEYRARERLDEHRLRARGREDTQIARYMKRAALAAGRRA
ncbi:hypothetical protein FIBSPDRAFT_879145 [Athelia psychrophila]|uniref:Uncharacterized protein n=1 Tax=Athelia psychrophila TaxID=1759441 RepID=A0A167UBN7_9AGAM|nr:hypothetical protein FIBSPDRAFT_879145 [Fibularhizoctonia sp. CBS 109695]